jgi:hypothetical protein
MGHLLSGLIMASFVGFYPHAHGTCDLPCFYVYGTLCELICLISIFLQHLGLGHNLSHLSQLVGQRGQACVIVFLISAFA